MPAAHLHVGRRQVVVAATQAFGCNNGTRGWGVSHVGSEREKAQGGAAAAADTTTETAGHSERGEDGKRGEKTKG